MEMVAMMGLSKVRIHEDTKKEDRKTGRQEDIKAGRQGEGDGEDDEVMGWLHILME